jgi:ribosomal protein S11
MTTTFTLLWKNTNTGEEIICERHGNDVYEVHKTEAAAQKLADKLNSMAKKAGWASEYRVIPLPEGLNPRF